jgi:hypothetical protein
MLNNRQETGSLDIFYKMNNRAQLSDAMTWIVATLVIILILVVFVFASSILAKTYKVASSLKSVGLGNSEEGVDIINLKNSFAFEKNKDNNLKIEAWLNEK